MVTQPGRRARIDGPGSSVALRRALARTVELWAVGRALEWQHWRYVFLVLDALET
jgi:hypothetical protein